VRSVIDPAPLTAEGLDAALELWARYVVSDRQQIRGLWYPQETPEHRYARRGGAAHVPATHALTPDLCRQSLADRVDTAMADLLNHNAKWFHAIRTHYVDGGNGFKREHLYAGKRWLRGKVGCD
jgi:hypothetical protein